MFLSVFFWQTRIDVRSETHDHQAGDFDDLKRSAVQGNGNYPRFCAGFDRSVGQLE